MSRRYWYFYSGTGSESDPSRYSLLAAGPGVCSSGQAVCAIYAHPNDLDPNKPQAGELSGTIQTYITAARVISDAYPVVPQKAFVYLKQSI